MIPAVVWALGPFTPDPFPTSPVIEAQKGFWIRIFAEVHSDQGLIHDGENTVPTYEKLSLGNLSRRYQRRVIRRHKNRIANDLRTLAAKLDRGEALDGPERTLLDKFPKDVTAERLRRASHDVRFQRGLADRFERGLKISGAYMPRIREILREHEVPLDLAYLPHVESSFNHRTYSRAGAAGIWQFTRGTGRMFMEIGYEVDERLDPFIAAGAAAELLKRNYRHLGSWPLAITAYNHGRQNLTRIIRRMGTDDLGELIRRCNCRLFRFASKNFYAEFLAARQVARNYDHYFGDLPLHAPLEFNEVKLPFYLDFARAAGLLGLSEEALSELNLSLRPPVLQGTKRIPAGFTLRIPSDTEPRAFLASVPAQARHDRQKATTEAVVMRGDTLYELGKRFDVPWQRIARANNISAYRRIRPGQRLVIPGRGSRPVERASAASESVALNSQPAAPIPSAADGSSEAPRRIPSSVAFQEAEGASLFQDLDLHEYRDGGRVGEIVSAYGETIGHYAEWAGTTARRIRALNGLNYGRLLRPGERISVPLRVKPESFVRKRNEYHRSREEDFFSVYAITEVEQVKVRRGDTVWSLAQNNNVPMWLFYQQNPKLIDEPVHAGTKVRVPIIEEISDLEEAGTVTVSGQAG